MKEKMKLLKQVTIKKIYLLMIKSNEIIDRKKRFPARTILLGCWLKELGVLESLE